MRTHVTFKCLPQEGFTFKIFANEPPDPLYKQTDCQCATCCNVGLHQRPPRQKFLLDFLKPKLGSLMLWLPHARCYKGNVLQNVHNRANQKGTGALQTYPYGLRISVTQECCLPHPQVVDLRNILECEPRAEATEASKKL